MIATGQEGNWPLYVKRARRAFGFLTLREYPALHALVRSPQASTELSAHPSSLVRRETCTVQQSCVQVSAPLHAHFCSHGLELGRLDEILVHWHDPPGAGIVGAGAQRLHLPGLLSTKASTCMKRDLIAPSALSGNLAMMLRHLSGAMTTRSQRLVEGWPRERHTPLRSWRCVYLLDCSSQGDRIRCRRRCLPISVFSGSGAVCKVAGSSGGGRSGAPVAAGMHRSFLSIAGLRFARLTRGTTGAHGARHPKCGPHGDLAEATSSARGVTRTTRLLADGYMYVCSGHETLGKSRLITP